MVSFCGLPDAIPFNSEMFVLPPPAALCLSRHVTFFFRRDLVRGCHSVMTNVRDERLSLLVCMKEITDIVPGSYARLQELPKRLCGSEAVNRYPCFGRHLHLRHLSTKNSFFFWY